MNQKTDLTKSEPRAFADTLKQLHSQMWQGRVKELQAALTKIS